MNCQNCECLKCSNKQECKECGNCNSEYEHRNNCEDFEELKEKGKRQMSEFDFWRECLTIPIDNIRDNRYYFYACEYMAKTELYDRWLTDERSPYDKTSAFINAPYVRRLSIWNCKRVREEIYQEILKEWNIDFARVNVSASVWIKSELRSEWQRIWNEIITHNRYSAQKWIDEYNWLLKYKGENIDEQTQL